jgi:hypothetical protein
MATDDLTSQASDEGAGGPTFRVRLRFRLQKRLNLDRAEHRIAVAGREVEIKADIPDGKICDSDWLVMNTRGFRDEAGARAFGHKLRASLEMSSVAARLGVDAGRDVATSGLSRAVRDEIERTTGALVRNNIHGVDVFEDDPNVRFIKFQATGTVRARPDEVLDGLNELYETAADASQRAKDVVLLLNFALMRPEPVAQIVFAVSAVEMLGQSETWTDDQRRLLGTLAETARQSSTGTVSERDEVADAITKSLHRLTLRQGVFRLLDSLGLGDLKRSWDDLYAERSTLVHGLAPRPGADYADLAHRTVSLCGRILLTALVAEVPGAARHIDLKYPR